MKSIQSTSDRSMKSTPVSALRRALASPSALLIFGAWMVGALGCSSGEAGPTALTGAELTGTWVSDSCEAYPNGQGGENYLTRDFTLTEKEWDLDLRLFGDKDCTAPLFDVKIHGPYSLGALSDVVDGATNGEFGIETNEWTARTQEMADLFAQSGCGTGTWEVGVASDVTATGCIGVAHKVSECPEEFDIVSVDGDELYFGERVTDMCKEEGRPKALAAFPVVRE